MVRHKPPRYLESVIEAYQRWQRTEGRTHSPTPTTTGPFTGLIATHQTPIIQHAPPDWRIWLSYDAEKTSGTYLVLRASGAIMRETLLPTGEVVNVVTITPA